MGDMAAATSSDDFHRPVVTLRDPDCPFHSILDLVDFNAKHNPNHTFAIQLTKDVDGGLTEKLVISFRTLKSTILACSNDLAQTVLGGAPEASQPVALLMASHVCLIIYMFALMHRKVPVVLLSARLSPSAIEHLLKATGTSKIIASANLLERVKDAVANHVSFEQFSVHEQESLEALIARDESMSMSSHTSLAQGTPTKHTEHSLILHSSGTTGMPKPIYHTERYLLAFATCHDLPVTPDGPCLSTLPLFHGYGLLPSCLALSVGLTVCLPPKSEIPNAPAMVHYLRLVNAGSLISVPSVLEDMAASDGLKVLKQLAFVAFGGGKLKESAGQALIVGGVPLLNHYGATESGPLAPIFVPGSDYDWHYFRLREDAGIQLQPTGVNDDGRQQFRLSVQPPGWNSIFQIQDELVRAPLSVHQNYAAVGRMDDVLVLANGEKVRPGILEAQVTEHPDVKSAIVFGNDQTEVGLLLQPAHRVDVQEHGRFVDLIWPDIQNANLLMDAHAQVLSKQCVIVVPHDAELPRSDKGSILRREVYTTFEVEISNVYTRLDNSVNKKLAEPLRWENFEDDISTMLHKHCHLRSQPGGLSPDDDLFARGLDSLQAVQLRRRQQASLANSQKMALQAESLPRDFVYRFPSIRKMADAMRGVHHEEFDTEFDQVAMDKLVAQYSTSNRVHIALITGATGGLGSHVVEHLAKSPNIHTVFCLIRPEPECDPKARLLKALSLRGLDLDEVAESKVRVLECDLASQDLGLSGEDYQQVLTSVRWVMHAGWPMDFKLTLASFAPAFQALRNLLSLVDKIGRSGRDATPKFVFISCCALDIGYARAKLVCEAIVEHASTHCSTATVQYIRMGQLCGNSKTGIWNEEEHIPALLKSSLVMGALPEMSGTLSWIPVDQAAEVACDILLDTGSERLCFHVESPIRQSWADMLSIIRRQLGLHKTTAYDQWLAELSQTASTDSPAVKLLPNFQTHFERMACGQVTLDTFAAREVSPALRRVGGVSDVEIGRYVARWRESGFLK
ncbi:Adenylate-forming reductase cicB [Fulvia fulva]|uniref:Adenylate-forming reductase cicB n=1 Tax=Passalora fulva TaxID=5499 RepID=A0A9Q8UVV2_PASFU|nr:Adenylate-forming reductase cicB [Fulvia fulva]KAK4611143.1 Adenylate-forming reductase cicB [Fulvia fulva]UJO24353.1 Adenylate-forming reductase cicB [Fulvia fulva]